MFIFCWLNNNIVHLFLCKKKIFNYILCVYVTLWFAYSLWAVSYYCFPLLFYLSIFYFIRVFFQELCAMFQPCNFYHFGKKTKTLPQKYIVPQRNERIKSDIKLSNYALFKRVLLFSSVRCLVLKAIKFICYPFWAPWRTQMIDFPTLSYPSTVKSLPFHIL